VKEGSTSFLKKRSKKLLIVGSLGAGLICGCARAAHVHVMVSGVRNARGHVLVAICSRAEFLQPHCAWQGGAPARAGIVTVDIADVPPGLYAAQAFHDEDDNKKLERSFFGLPEEGMGFSRDARMRFGPPAFADAAFAVGGDVAVQVALHYY
jgi:uncharacterized protein (DUF2141 family)